MIKQQNSPLYFNVQHTSANWYSDGGHPSCEFNCLPSPAEGSVYFHVYRVGMAALAWEWTCGKYEDLSGYWLQYKFIGSVTDEIHNSLSTLKCTGKIITKAEYSISYLFFLRILQESIYVYWLHSYMSRITIHSHSAGIFMPCIVEASQELFLLIWGLRDMKALHCCNSETT